MIVSVFIGDPQLQSFETTRTNRTLSYFDSVLYRESLFMSLTFQNRTICPLTSGNSYLIRSVQLNKFSFLHNIWSRLLKKKGSFIKCESKLGLWPAFVIAPQLQFLFARKILACCTSKRLHYLRALHIGPFPLISAAGNIIHSKTVTLVAERRPRKACARMWIRVFAGRSMARHGDEILLIGGRILCQFYRLTGYLRLCINRYGIFPRDVAAVLLR